MSKYKVGDKVVIIEDLEVNGFYSMEDPDEVNVVVPEMLEFRGDTMTIKSVKESGYKLVEDDYNWTWTDGMFSGKASHKDLSSVLKVGDKVLIRSDLSIGEVYGDLSFVKYMAEFLGEVVTVSSVDDAFFLIEEDNNHWCWSLEMIERPVEGGESWFFNPDDDDDDDDVESPTFFYRDLDEDEDEDEDIEVQWISDDDEGEDDDGNYWDDEGFMKYKIGDMVKIRTDLVASIYDIERVYNNEKGRPFAEDIVNDKMVQFMGKKAVVEDIVRNKYVLKDVNGLWTDEMIEGLVEQKINESHEIGSMVEAKIHVDRIIFNQPATIMFYRVPDFSEDGSLAKMSGIRKVVAKCNPKDDFDRDQGMKACILKAMRKEADRELKNM